MNNPKRQRPLDLPHLSKRQFIQTIRAVLTDDNPVLIVRSGTSGKRGNQTLAVVDARSGGDGGAVSAY
ncbi:MAG: hypothetical protein R3C01_02170 [Planctomycetaceae bacterium]